MRPIKYKIYLLLLGCFLAYTAKTQNGSFITKVPGVPLTDQQQHYLNSIKSYPQYISHEIVEINIDELEQELVPVSLDNHLNVALNKKRIEYRNENDYSWFGSVGEYSFSSVNIVVNKNMVSANIRFNDMQYSIWPLGDGLHALTFESPANFSDHGEEYEQIPKIQMNSVEQEIHYDDGTIEYYTPSLRPDSDDDDFRGSGECKIRILAAFTDDVDAANADPRGQIQLALDNYNASNDNSGVGFDVELARVVEVSYPESLDFDTDLARFKGVADGYMDNVHSLRSLYDADYSILVVQDVDENCGLAETIGATYSTAFCVGLYSCIAGNLTFAHEFAHLHGCRHDPYVDSDNSPYSNGHGYVNIGSMWRTVMAYNDMCEDFNTSCTRLQYWSTPDENVPASWGGGVCGIAGVSDNEAVLDFTDITVFNWEAQGTNKGIFVSDIIYDDEEGNFEGASACSNTSTPGSVLVDYRNGSKGMFRAGDVVVLRPGFWARTGSQFTAFLSSCTPITTKTSTLAQEQSGVFSQNDEIAKNSIKVYPNPFQEIANLEIMAGNDDIVDIIIFDALGRQVLQVQSKVTIGINKIELDLTGKPSGIYQITVNGESVKSAASIVKS